MPQNFTNRHNLHLHIMFNLRPKVIYIHPSPNFEKKFISFMCVVKIKVFPC